MVDRHVAARGIKDARILQAMREVPRHRFVPPVVVTKAYGPGALPIGKGQTISQPYIVARNASSFTRSIEKTLAHSFESTTA